jgi:sialate O-acetylesterase
MNVKLKLSLVLLTALNATLAARADIKLHRVFTDHMVLQRDMNVNVWGWADPGEKVSVQFGGQNLSAIGDDKGKWSVKLTPMEANTTPQNLIVTGKNKIELTDILVGDVWLCSGQSNMAFGVGGINTPEDIKSADYTLMRFRGGWGCWSGPLMEDLVEKPWYRVAIAEDLARLKGWKRIVPDVKAIDDCPAVGFYFARKVQKETGVPIGLLECAIGGSSIEAWLPPTAFTDYPAVAYLAKQRREAIDNWHKKTIADMENWVAEAKKNLAEDKDISNPPAVAPHPNEDFRGRCEVSTLYNGMINPLIQFPIKGVLWYQGENNGSEQQTYIDKLSALAGSWRKLWGYDFPFYYVQLPNFEQAVDDPSGGQPGWQMIRMGMLQALNVIPNSGMAVTIDVGDPKDIHPRNKRDVGQRLALWALAKDYGKTGLVYASPLYKSMQIEGGRIRIAFDDVGGGLMIGKKDGLDLVVEDQDAKLKRFAIAGEDKKWVWADAVIDSKTVVVSSPEVPRPVAVRYAYSMNPDGCNLYNKEGLPASPFRTDNW